MSAVSEVLINFLAMIGVTGTIEKISQPFPIFTGPGDQSKHQIVKFSEALESPQLLKLSSYSIIGGPQRYEVKLTTENVNGCTLVYEVTVVNSKL